MKQDIIDSQQVQEILAGTPSMAHDKKPVTETLASDTICSLIACLLGIFVGLMVVLLTNLSYLAVIVAALLTAAAVRRIEALGSKVRSKKK